MQSLPKALLLPAGVFIGSLLTVASSVGQSAPVAFQACVGADRVLRLPESGECGRNESSVPLGSIGPGPARLPGAPAPERLDSVVSPNGQFAVDVDNNGITLSGGGAILRLANGGISVDSTGDIAVTTGANLRLAGAETSVSAASVLRLTAAVIKQN